MQNVTQLQNFLLKKHFDESIVGLQDLLIPFMVVKISRLSKNYNYLIIKCLNLKLCFLHLNLYTKHESVD